MKGIILCGGNGTRLWPLTKVTNKHLLPVYDMPMIYHPIKKMVKSGITDILLVVGGNSAGEFIRILGNGEEFGLKRLHYAYQKDAGGIAAALSLAEDFAGNDNICVMLGDNVFEKPFGEQVKEFDSIRSIGGAAIFLAEVENPEWYGVVELDETGEILSLEEKPACPKSKTIATGLYFYRSDVFHWIKELKPSGRGELEITDLNKHYLANNANPQYRFMGLKAYKLESAWMDCGESIPVYLKSCNKVKELGI